MPDLTSYVHVATIVSTLAKALDTGLSYFKALRQVEAEPAKIEAAAKQLQSTYDDAEIKSLLERIQGCRDRFVDEGHGPNRKRCLCSVLRDAKSGNGGRMPVDEWDDMYSSLGCAA